MVLPRTLKDLKKSAFKGCTAIKEIIVPAENEKYIMKQLPKELHRFVKVTTKNLVDTTPEPVIEAIPAQETAPAKEIVKEPAPASVETSIEKTSPAPVKKEAVASAPAKKEAAKTTNKPAEKSAGKSTAKPSEGEPKSIFGRILSLFKK